MVNIESYGGLWWVMVMVGCDGSWWLWWVVVGYGYCGLWSVMVMMGCSWLWLWLGYADINKQSVFFLQTADLWSTSSPADVIRRL